MRAVTLLPLHQLWGYHPSLFSGLYGYIAQLVYIHPDQHPADNTLVSDIPSRHLIDAFQAIQAAEIPQ